MKKGAKIRDEWALFVIHKVKLNIQIKLQYFSIILWWEMFFHHHQNSINPIFFVWCAELVFFLSAVWYISIFSYPTFSFHRKTMKHIWTVGYILYNENIWSDKGLQYGNIHSEYHKICSAMNKLFSSIHPPKIISIPYIHMHEWWREKKMFVDG